MNPHLFYIPSRVLGSILLFFGFFIVGYCEEIKTDLDLSTGLPFQDHAIVQQLIPIPVWGIASPNSEITVEFNGQKKKGTAESSGNWSVTFDPMKAYPLKSVNEKPKGHTMTITARLDQQEKVITRRDIVIGEVWLGAGQSNMAGSLRTIIEKKKDASGKSILNGTKVKEHKLDFYPADTISSADFPGLRQLVSPISKWTVCQPETAWEFKKVCFYFARRLHRETLIPIGIINAAVGGSRIETWLNQEPYSKGKNYQDKVEPLLGYAIRGMLWYQGESNAKDGRDYQPKLQSLIQGWRKTWGQAKVELSGAPRSPFSAYFVQLPGISNSPTDHPAMGDGRAEIRQAYLETLKVLNTGMAIALELGDVKEHPPNKYDTGVRLAQLALHYDYGRQDLVPSGPVYRNHKIEGSSVIISFDHAEKGLMIAEKSKISPPEHKPDAKLGWVSIRDEKGVWHWAESKIEGNTLVVTHPQVMRPYAVRYAYTNRPTGPLLYNKSGLPASPFSTAGYGPRKEE